ncbi:tetratricopeptide repeat protein [Chloroflexota bacterium]
MIILVILAIVPGSGRLWNPGFRYRNWANGLILLGCIILMVGCKGVSQETALPPSPILPEARSQSYVLAVQATDGQLNSAGHIQLAETTLLRGNRKAALAHYAAAAHEQNTAQAWRLVADSLLAQRDWLAARDVLDALLVSDPTNSTAHYQLGVLLLPHDPRQAYEHLTVAAADAQLGSAAEALQAVIVASEMALPSVQYLQTGMALASLEQWGLAEQSFTLAVTFDPGYAEAWAYLDLARAQQDKSVGIGLEQAVLLSPTSATILLLSGLVAQIQGDHVAALQFLRLAQEQDPQNPAIAAELGSVYRLLGDYAAAEQWLQTAVGLAPADARFMTLLALFYVDAGYDLAGDGLAVLQAAVDGQPENAELQAIYAWALFNQGEHTAAQAAIAQARFLAPDNPRVLYYQGLLHQAANQNDLAVDVLLELLHHPAPQGFDVLARHTLERLDHEQ